jgi:hypothetical protein
MTKVVRRKNYVSGFGEKDPDAQAFLRSDPSPWNADGHSTVGFNAKFEDDAGTRDYAGYGVDGADDSEAFLRPSSVGDIDGVNANHGYLIDNDPSLPNNKLLAGGGPLSQKGGIGAGPPRHAPKNVGHAGQQNRDARGGIDKTGRGRR